MRHLSTHFRRAFICLLISIISISLLWNYPFPRPTSLFFNEVLGQTSIDFTACPSTQQGVSIQYGYEVYQLKRMLPGLCRMRFARVVETFEWDGNFTSTCLVPSWVGKQTFIIRGFGIEKSPIEAYCFSHTETMALSGITLIVSIVLFLLLSGIGWYRQKRAVRKQSSA